MKPPCVRYAGLAPTYATAGSSGADLHANISGPMTIEPQKSVIVPTGTFVEIPEDYEGQVRPRSGLSSKHGIIQLNSPGTIDSDYRGEILVPLFNISDKAYTIQPKERIAQLVIHPLVRVQFEAVEQSSLSQTGRAEKGFGSTGKF